MTTTDRGPFNFRSYGGAWVLAGLVWSCSFTAIHGQTVRRGMANGQGQRVPVANAPQHRWAQNSAARMGFTPLHQKLSGSATGPNAGSPEAGSAAAGGSVQRPRPASFAEPTPADPTAPTGTGAVGPTAPSSIPGPTPQATVTQPLPSGNSAATEILPPSVSGDTYAVDGYADGQYAIGGAYDCGDGSCVGCQSGGPCQVGCSRRWWVRTNYLHWWTKGSETPALLTTSSETTVSTGTAALGDAQTSVLYGGSPFHEGSRSGFELELGTKISPYGERTLQVRYLFLGEVEDSFATSSDRIAVLGRPFLDVETGDQAASLIGFPNVVDGNIAINSSTKFWLLDAVGDNVICSSCDYQHHWQIGYRTATLDDSLSIDQNIVARGTQSGLATGTTLEVNDSIRTANKFNGVVLGWSTELARFPWVVELRARSALGTTDAEAQLAGSTTTTVPNGNPTTTSNGLLVQPTNDGVFSDSRFAMLPEFGIQLHRDYAFGARVTLGYSFLYWSNVLRATEQIDTKVNQSQLPPGNLDGAPLPEYTFRFTDFWAQGATLGCEFRY